MEKGMLLLRGSMSFGLVILLALGLASTFLAVEASAQVRPALVQVTNNADQAVPIQDVRQSITTSARAVILQGEGYTTAEAAIPACPAGNKFLVNGLHVGPEILIGATSIDVTQLPKWGASLWIYQKASWGAFAVPLNLLGDGPQHLSVTLPSGQSSEFTTTLTTYIVLLGGVTAPKRFEFNVHITGYCGAQFIKP